MKCVMLFCCVAAVSAHFVLQPLLAEPSKEESDYAKQLEDAFWIWGKETRRRVIRNLFRTLEFYYRRQLADRNKELAASRDEISKLSIENERLSCRLWYSKIRILLDDYEKRYGSDVDCTLSKEEEKGLGNTEKDRAEKARRRRAKMWRGIFEQKGDEYPIKKLRATIEAQKPDQDSWERKRNKNYFEFCDGLSWLIDILHERDHVYLDASELGNPNPMRLFEKENLRATFITVFESEYGKNLLPCFK